MSSSIRTKRKRDEHMQRAEHVLTRNLAGADGPAAAREAAVCDLGEARH